MIKESSHFSSSILCDHSVDQKNVQLFMHQGLVSPDEQYLTIMI